jgi:tetratricopeptide (TPR) repeat protein
MGDEEIFHQALSRSTPEERAAYLEQACAGNPVQRSAVEALLRANVGASGFMDRPAFASIAMVEELISERPGAVIGPYKLLEQIGEGGFGVVFMAEQQQPIRRKLALKVLKPGMDTKQVIARFEAERQALALMDHPSIARVFDGGATDSGRPYFVMELVRGLSLTDYCDQNNLSIHKRLELFVNVCQAVQHAHQKGIIHRDIKPSNILVTLHDGVPVAKVIDFGIAKAVGQQLTEKSLFTNFAQMIGTPLYMSPEQAEMSGLDVDTRSDIYSLGVLMYELLTGTTPFCKERLKQAGFDEVRRIIREEEPPTPSTRMSTVGQAATTASERRQSDPRKLSRLFRGELDWIVMRALEKDRNRRYETASAFAADVQRYLKDEPVQARPPSATYRLRKFSRRNRSRLAIAIVLGLALLAVAGSVGWMLRDRASRHQRLLGQVEYALDEAELDLKAKKWVQARTSALRAQSLLASGAGDDRLDQRAVELLTDLDMVATIDEILLEAAAVKDNPFDFGGAITHLAQAFQRYGIDVEALSAADAADRIRKRPIAAELTAGLDAWAHRISNGEIRRKLVAIARQADPEDDQWRQALRLALEAGEPQTIQRLAEEANQQELAPNTIFLLTDALVDQKALTDKAVSNEGSAKLAIALLRKAQLQHPGDFWVNHMLARYLHLVQPPRLDEAIGYYRAALALKSQSPGAWLVLGSLLMDRRDLAGAIAANQKAISLKPDFAVAHNQLGIAFVESGQMHEAIAEFHEAIGINEDYPDAHGNLGNVLSGMRQWDEAITEYRKVLRIKDILQAHFGLAHALYSKGQLDEAITEYGKVIQVQKDNPAAHGNLGIALLDKGQWDEAIAEFRVVLSLIKDDPLAHSNLGRALLAKRQWDDAIIEFGEVIQINKKDFGAHYNLGNALKEKGRLDEAIAEYKKAIQFNEDFAEAHCNLGLALRDRGHFAEALTYLRRGHELGSKNSPRWTYPSARWVKECERFVELDAKLTVILAGKEAPASAEQRTELAALCNVKHQYQMAARFYEEAFAAQPKLADRVNSHRYNAACAAALAGCGQGMDANQSGDKDRIRFRRLSLDWLRADLAASGELLAKDADKVRPAMAQMLDHWQHDRDFAGVRDPDELAKLPSDEQAAWRGLWADVAKTLERVSKPK